jgi:Flp pilus assembly protein TadD
MAAHEDTVDGELAAMRFQWGKADSEEMRVFREGIEHLRRNALHSALEAFRRAFDLEKTNPYFMSFYGLLLARVERNLETAERMCTEALKMKRRQPQLYANLAEVYLIAGRRSDAVDVLQEGIHYEPGDSRLLRMLARLGIRRPPVLPFLDRGHSLNITLGRLRHRMLQFVHRN